MRIKCPQCKAKIDKKSQYCQYCGYEIFSNKEDKPSGYNFTSKTVFVTNGDVFEIGKEVALLGIAVQKISVGDILNFNGKDLIIQRIDLFKEKNVPIVEKGNCVLVFNNIDFKKFKKEILKVCEELSSSNQPIAFGKDPTTKYTFIDLK